MKARWILNLVLLLIVAGVGAFLVLRPVPEVTGSKAYQVSQLNPASFSKIRVEFPAKKAVQLERLDNIWYLTLPYKARASRQAVDDIAKLVTASSTEKFPAGSAAQYGLDNPVMRLLLDDQEFTFGTHHPLTSEQYVRYKDAIYLVSNAFSEAAATQVTELIDKRPFAPGEYISGFDLAHLEQWESTALNVDMVAGEWKVSSPKAKPQQQELNQWFEDSWQHLTATAVEPYHPDSRQKYPSLEVKLKSGKKVHFDKLQESPELLLARPDEGMLYHFPQEVGFTALNPPVGFRPE